jgi:superfamily II DNA helicase RecQ
MSAQLMFISAEHASMDMVSTFLLQVHLSGRLSRIVVDECHLSVTWSKFRSSVNKLRGLKIYPVPLVLLSATVPPHLEQRLRIHFGSQFMTIRKPTVRPELQYQVRVAPQQAVMDKIIVQTLWRHDGRILPWWSPTEVNLLYIPLRQNYLDLTYSGK